MTNICEIHVSGIEVDRKGIKEVFLSEELGSILEEICENKAKNLDAVSSPHIHDTGVHNSLFAGRKKKLSHTYIGTVSPKVATDLSGNEVNIGAAINSKHGTMGW